MFYPGMRIKELRIKRGLSQENLAKKLGMNRVNISHYERGVITKIPSDVLAKLADIFGVSTDYLLGKTDDPSPSNNSDWDSKLPELTEKDEKDIAKDLQRIMDSLESQEGLMYDGEPMDEETKELIKISLENSMRLAKRIAKKKFTPKKYRK
ncbi:Transcriptional regulator, contains XRE-family HTH domain [Parageobacillus thermantarcticus]|uniref:Transcriptional regulator, contains XRE-family HTH domain n=1 Tax=Parageobacillus thermantarcticus TaxID=186116 RepID=A0A1I0T842_9BACL|nr:helix-turn-helix domain-containing protein [Parageobacillus thermantarcticus]SFA47763.1 Transcriptional regulator, contains XRE-family HTH domain [Parageobacillus thermantarcticus]